MSDNLIVRVANKDDVHDVMALTMSCHVENGFVNADPIKILQELWPALIGEGGVVGIIGGRGKPLEGCVVLRTGKMSYSNEDVLEEKFLFVHPEYRSAKGCRARLLAEFTKRIADGLGIPLIIGVISSHRTEAKVRLYKRLFGEPAGVFFLYGAKTGLNMNHPEVEN